MFHIESLLYLLIYLASALGWWVADHHFGVKLLHFFDRWTSEGMKAEKKDKGLIVGRGAQFRFGVAVIIATLQTYLFYRGMPLIHILVAWGAQVVVLFAGFYLGPWAIKTWQAKKKIFGFVDKVESGEIDVVKEAKKFVDETTEQMKSAVHVAAEEISALAHHSALEKKPAVPKESVRGPTKETPEETFKRFINKK